MIQQGPATRVLVVEDCRTQAVTLRKVLRSVGYEVEVAHDGREGLDAFAAARFDLVISDVMMPGLSGYELCRRIKALPEGGGVPVVLLTSLGEPEDMIRGLECGADSFIRKPYEDEALIGRIGDVLASRALRVGRHPGAEVELDFMGGRFAINSGRAQVLDFLAATFEDFVRSTTREHHQPIVSLTTGRVAGFEALARWHHPVRGLVGPSEFIPLAEETGLIVPLGLWVLREACLWMHAWRDVLPAGPTPVMSVNLSGRQLTQPDLVEGVARTLRETGLDPRCLRLEITESVAMGDAEAAIAVLGRLKGLGLRLSLDDFGTGYSSLSYLHRFPLDTLKVDRSFVGRIDDDGGETGIVRAIVALAHGLGMEVVAEGVETEGQAILLRKLGCQYGQGYYFSRPLDGEAAGALFARGPQRSLLASA